MPQKIPKHINHLYLMLTEQCPLDCQYCYIENRTEKSLVSIHDVNTIINLFEHPNPRIIFFGGEPLLQFDLLFQIVEEHKEKCHFQVVTSGLVNFNKFLKRVATEYPDKFDIQVSWDGMNNDNRLLRSGKNKQQQVLNTIIDTLEVGLPFQVRSVINDNNVQNLHKIVRTFRFWKHNYPQFHGDITIAHQKQFKPLFHIHLANQIKEILNDVQEDLNDGIHPYLPMDIMKRIINVAIGKPVSSCDAGNYIVLRPNGDLYPCTILSQVHDVDFKLCSTDTLDEIDWDKFDIMRQPSKDSRCHICNYKSLCDGGCRYERVMNFGENWRESVCDFTCNINEVWFETITNWIESLTKKERMLFNNVLTKYMLWGMHYDTGHHDKAKEYRTIDLNDIIINLSKLKELKS